MEADLNCAHVRTLPVTDRRPMHVLHTRSNAPRHSRIGLFTKCYGKDR